MKIFGGSYTIIKKMSKVSESRDVEMQSMSESKGSASSNEKSSMNAYDLPRQCVAEFVGTSMVRICWCLILREHCECITNYIPTLRTPTARMRDRRKRYHGR